MRGRRIRTTARVARVQEARSWCTVQAWCAGAVLVPVETTTLVTATGLPPRQLLGRELTVSVMSDAQLEEELRPTGWEAAPSPGMR